MFAMFKFDTAFKLRLLLIFNHTLAIYFLIFQFNFRLAIISIVIYCLIGCLGISIGFHRLLSHRSFKAPVWFENVVTLLGFYATGGPPIAWIAFHRLHHAFIDTDKDPHSCKHLSPLRIYFSVWNNIRVPSQIVRDLYKKNLIVFLTRHYFKLLFLIILAFSFWGFDKLAYFYCLPAVLSFHFFGLTNLLGHQKDQSTLTAVNKSIISVFAFGEGWHLHHHLNANSYRIGIGPHEYDISAFIIEKLGFLKK